MNDLEKLRVDVAKELGWQFVLFTPVSSGGYGAIKPVYDLCEPGWEGDNPYWNATVIDEWPDGWESKRSQSPTVPKYSTDMGAAGVLLQDVMRQGAGCKMARYIVRCTDPRNNHTTTGVVIYNNLKDGWLGEGNELPEAICRA